MDRPLSRHNLCTTIGSNVRLARHYRNTAFQQSGQRTPFSPVRINCRPKTLGIFPFVSAFIRSHQQQACNNDAVTAVQHNTHNRPSFRPENFENPPKNKRKQIGTSGPTQSKNQQPSIHMYQHHFLILHPRHAAPLPYPPDSRLRLTKERSGTAILIRTNVIPDFFLVFSVLSRDSKDLRPADDMCSDFWYRREAQCFCLIGSVATRNSKNTIEVREIDRSLSSIPAVTFFL